MSDDDKKSDTTKSVDEKVKAQDMKEFEPPPNETEGGKKKEGMFAWFWKAFGGNA
jgi:hypothetical protein